MKRATFGSRLGAILAAAGSAVGLGNIWRFPCETGANGGAAFILIYIVCIVIVAVPTLIAELSLGRAARANAYDTFTRLAQGRLHIGAYDSDRVSHPSPLRWVWNVVGAMSIMAGFVVFAYYSVVAGWTLQYTASAGCNELMGQTAQDYVNDFQAFSADPVKPIIALVIFVSITTSIIVLGVRKGIELASKIMMPLLFILLAVLACCSLSLPGASKGLEFLFYPDFSKITPSVFLSAMGQAFFTLSIGVGCLMTYASYFSDDVHIVKDSFTLAAIDTLVAILAGVIILPAALSVGVHPGVGPSLVFVTLPYVFQQAFGGLPWLCYVVTLMFYLLLCMAALTSSISMLEITTAFVTEKFSLPRWKGTLLIAIFTVILGSACSLGFGAWNDVTVFGMDVFSLCDFFVAKIVMPVVAIFMCILLRRLGKRNVSAMLTNNGKLHIRWFCEVYYFMVKWVIPLLIFVIMVHELL